MREGRISRTALKVATIVAVIGEMSPWSELVPDGAAELSRRLLIEANVPMYRAGMFRFTSSSVGQRLLRRRASEDDHVYRGVLRRKAYMHARVLEALEAGARQVLVIGAGFDTLALRLAPRHPDVRFVEVDHPATSAAKRRGVEAIGARKNLHLAAVDLGVTPLSAAMRRLPGWDPGGHTVAVAEGLLM